MELAIAVDDPRTPDVRAILDAHLAWIYEVTPEGHVHALDLDGLLDDSITLYSARSVGEVVGIGALKRLDDSHAELKSMHALASFRGRGVGKAMVEHLLAVAREQGFARVSLETGTLEAFVPARAMYAKFGFRPCEPFNGYTKNPHSTCMTLEFEAHEQSLVQRSNESAT